MKKNLRRVLLVLLFLFVVFASINLARVNAATVKTDDGQYNYTTVSEKETELADGATFFYNLGYTTRSNTKYDQRVSVFVCDTAKNSDVKVATWNILNETNDGFTRRGLLEIAKDYEKHNVIIASSDNNNKKTYNLIKEEEEKSNFKYNEKDFELINENIYIKYLLIYNNNKINNKLYKLLISILDMFDIIIKDNMDLVSVFDIFKNLFKKIITKNFELIEKMSSNKLKNIEIISNCYSIILSNS